mgnify:CR=1 FL=1|tara:strand:+ start:179 stop:340 length:162 start_codon:yes stop_codon:yes gene_type:complete
MTQIMNLSNLAPEIQEAILFSPRVEQEGDSVTEAANRISRNCVILNTLHRFAQ